MRVMFLAPVSGFGPADTGYGTAASGIAIILEKMKQEGKIDELALVSTLKVDMVNLPEGEFDVAIIVANPHTFKHERASQLILSITAKAKKRYLSVVWETFPLPQGWDPLWDWPMIDGFLAPSYFVATQLVRHTKKPVYYYPHYVDTESLPHIDPVEKAKENMFTTLFIGQHTKRKGLEEAVIAFTRALGTEEDARMIVKTHILSDRELPLEQTIFHNTVSNCIATKVPIYMTTDMLSREDIGKMIASASMLLFPSRGEGFGLPPAEAMTVGIPVVYTDWSATPEISNAPGNIAIPYYLDEAHSMLHLGYELTSYYAIPRMDALIRATRMKYMQWKKDRLAYFQEVNGNLDIVRQKFGMEAITKCLENIFNGGPAFAPADIYDEAMWNRLVEEWNQADADRKSMYGTGI